MSSRPEKRLCFVGALPLPAHGQTVYTEMVLRSSELNARFEVTHLDTSDHRDLSQVGRLDLENVYIGLKNVVQLCSILVRRKVGLLYVPVSQNALAYLRDFLFLAVGRLSGTSLVVHIHGGYFWEFYRTTIFPMRWIIKWSFRWVARAIVLGEKFRPLLGDLIPLGSVSVVPNGISAMRSPADTEVSDSGREIQITYLGNLMKAKGVLDILKAAVHLVECKHEFRITLAGPWYLDSDRAEAESILGSRPEVRARVEFVGPVGQEEKAELLNRSDIFLFPTRYPFEGQPLVLIEALAAGLPVVTTDHGCISETIVDGENGFLVEKDDPKEIAVRILNLMDDQTLRHRMGRVNRERYEENYTEEKSVGRLCDVLDEVLVERAANRAS